MDECDACFRARVIEMDARSKYEYMMAEHLKTFHCTCEKEEDK
jgi:hypothetical protein